MDISSVLSPGEAPLTPGPIQRPLFLFLLRFNAVVSLFFKEESEK